MKSAWIMALAFTAGATALAEPTLEVTELGADQFRLDLLTDQTTDVALAQQSLLPTAQRLCAGKQIEWGRYEFETIEPAPGAPTAATELKLRQWLACVVAVAASAADEIVLAPHDDQAVERLSLQFLSRRDAGDFEKAHAMLAPSMRALVDLERWTESARDLLSRVGPVSGRRIKKITWYDNPPNALSPGTYAAADYEQEAAGARIYCGYLIWAVSSQGEYGVIREEVNLVEDAVAHQMDPAQLQATADQLGCALQPGPAS